MARRKKQIDLFWAFFAIFILGVLAVSLIIKPISSTEKTYRLWKYSCAEPESRFESLSVQEYNQINESYILRLKATFPSCQISEDRNISQAEFEDINKNCFEWSGKAECPQGFELVDNVCRDLKTNDITNKLIACSRFKSSEGEIIEVLE